jgi:glycosyltransferase involved in cell wall biosynthesis
VSGQPEVTWLVAVKDAMPFLTETLASIEAQTYPAHRVILWDNGSTDGTVAEAATWVPSRIPGKVVADCPLFLGLSRAALLNAAETEYCAIIDGDDLAKPNRLETQVEFMDAHPEVAVSSCFFEKISEDGASLDFIGESPLHHDEIVPWFLAPSPICQPGVMLRRSAILGVGNYREQYLEDYDLWMRLAHRHKLANIGQVLISYRVHENSFVRSSVRENRHRPAILECASQYSQSLFGLDPETVVALMRREHPYAWPEIKRMAEHLQATQGGGDRTRNLSFLKLAKRLVSKSDKRSRAMIELFRLRKRIDL